jgi:transposase
MDGMTIMRVYNWKKHNKIKENEVDFLLKKALQIIDDNKEPWTEKQFGRPPYPPKPMVGICLMKVYFGMPYRDLESLIRSNKTLQELLQLEEVPDHNTIQRSMEKIPMEYLKHLNQQLAMSFKKSDRTLPSMQLDSASGSSTNHGSTPKEHSGRKST